MNGRKMRQSIILLLLLVGINAGVAQIKILPTPFSDRTFVYVKVGEIYQETPLQTGPALVPAVRVVVGENEAATLMQAAGEIAAAIANWADDPGATLSEIKAGAFPEILRLDTEISETETQTFNLIVVGANNKLAQRFANETREISGPSLVVMKNALVPNHDLMLVAGRNSQETRAAAKYLAHTRLYFKSGAYRGFVGFVRLRGYLENENFKAAGLLLNDPNGVRGCGKPVMLALPGMQNQPAEFRQTAQHRNELVFKNIREAVAQKNKTSALSLWQETMATCYACHQGRGTQQYRKFIPPEEPHYLHSLITVDQFGFECKACHTGVTEQVGYAGQ